VASAAVERWPLSGRAPSSPGPTISAVAPFSRTASTASLTSPGAICAQLSYVSMAFECIPELVDAGPLENDPELVECVLGLVTWFHLKILEQLESLALGVAPPGGPGEASSAGSTGYQAVSGPESSFALAVLLDPFSNSTPSKFASVGP